MIYVILQIIFTRLDECPFLLGSGSWEKLLFACGVTGCSKDEIFAVASAPGADVETLICLLVDEHILCVWSAHNVAVELVLALLFLVFNGIKESAIVAGPDDGADALDVFCQQFTRAHILNLQSVLAESCCIG